ncbi:MAG: sulfurtransferase-like selenium metabolism protein YedF [Proteobacteria bacterium]|nr:sulfurtransferase-like selenium metabolism protein YedF [Pseudomonadota bacterium]MBU1596698.1 sulfurtransferase-like selenium metabolism protein YedF [Pseudomonadota bacterium]
MQNELALDCRGLACPGPVMRCLEVIEKGAPEALLVLVDDPAARENVTRLLSGKGYHVAVAEAVGHSRLRATRLNTDPSAVPAPAASPCSSGPDMVAVFIASETIGAGDDELGGRLMLNFLTTLPELGKSLWRVILVNGGVRLATANHPCLEKLQALAAAGVSVLVCGTCLTHFGLMEAKQVGETTNMLDVVTSLHLAGKVIRV